MAIQQVANPEVNVHVVAVGIVAFAFGDRPVLIDVRIHVELPWKAASVDGTFCRRTNFTRDWGGNGGSGVRCAGAEVGDHVDAGVGEQLNLLQTTICILAQVDDRPVVVVSRPVTEVNVGNDAVTLVVVEWIDGPQVRQSSIDQCQGGGGC